MNKSMGMEEEGKKEGRDNIAAVVEMENYNNKENLKEVIDEIASRLKSDGIKNPGNRN
jgi:phosphopantothenate synthetase